MEKALAWIWMRQTIALPPHKIMALVERFGSAEAFCLAGPGEWNRCELLSPKERAALKQQGREDAEEILRKCRAAGIRPLCPDDAEYPPRLRQLYDPPAVLYQRGQLPPEEKAPAIAMVGQRKATEGGRKIARRFAQVFSAHGVTVVSGLAYGIDAAAHEGALEGAAPTVAVFGTAIDQCYPASHSGMLRRILENGAAVSEAPPGARTYPADFPKRNRIISGLANGVLVVEAPRKSGSLITASYALEQGREVYAIPGPIDSPHSEGCNLLIRSGAQLVTDPIQVLEELLNGAYPLLEEQLKQAAPQKTEKNAEENIAPVKMPSVTPQEARILAAFSGKTQIDDLCRGAEMTAAQVLTSLTMLEIKGIIKQLPGKYFEIL